MSTTFTKPPHGKVDYENIGLKNLLKEKNGGFSSLSATPTRYTIKNLEELNAGFEIITNSFQDVKNQKLLTNVRPQLETFKKRAEYIHNLQENGQLLPKYIVNYIEKEQNYHIITTTAKETLVENRKSNKVQLEEEKPTIKLLNNFNGRDFACVII
jgi:spore germination protein YaaH